MELHVKRNENGAFIDAEILNLSTEDWVVIQMSLKESLIAGKETLDYFQKSIEHKIERQYELYDIEDTLKLTRILESDIDVLEKLIKAFDEPITTRVAVEKPIMKSERGYSYGI